jgi:hypothetical protein
MTSLEDLEATSSTPILYFRIRTLSTRANQYGDNTFHLQVYFSTSSPTTTMRGEALSRIVTPLHDQLRYQRKQLTPEELRAQLHRRTPVVPTISPADVIRELRDEP